MTRAEVLAEYLGLTPNNAPAGFYSNHSTCQNCRSTVGRACRCNADFDVVWILIAPDPLAPGTAADAWLGVLVRSENFKDMHRWHDGTFSALTRKEGCCKYIEEADPTPAIVRAMMAADPAFAAKMEGAEG